MDIYLEKTEYFVLNLFILIHFGIYLVLCGFGGGSEIFRMWQIELQTTPLFTFFTFFIFFRGHISGKIWIFCLKSLQIESFCDLFGAIAVGVLGGGLKYAESGKSSFRRSTFLHFFRFLHFFLDIYQEKSEYFVSNRLNLSHMWSYWCYRGWGGRSEICRIWPKRAPDDPIFYFFYVFYIFSWTYNWKITE